MVKRIEKWVASDGSEWKTQKEAEYHERQKKLEAEFPKIYGSSEGCKIEYDDFKDWLENDGGENWLRQYWKLEG